MAVKTFTTGEVLTASDTNTYLANSGLVVVTPSGATNGTVSGSKVTIGTGVTSVTVSGVFSSTYDNYRIIVAGGTASGNFTTHLTLGSAATGYYYAGAYCTFAGAVSASSGANVAYWLTTAHNANSVVADIFVGQPNLAKNTTYSSTYYGPSTGDGAFAVQGYLNDTTQYTAFTLTASSGTYTGGTIMVYGYRLG